MKQKFIVYICYRITGNAKGQGQGKDVVYNRRQKTANKGAGGSWKKNSDFKRKEF